MGAAEQQGGQLPVVAACARSVDAGHESDVCTQPDLVFVPCSELQGFAEADWCTKPTWAGILDDHWHLRARSRQTQRGQLEQHQHRRCPVRRVQGAPVIDDRLVLPPGGTITQASVTLHWSVQNAATSCSAIIWQLNGIKVGEDCHKQR
ncbi:hypothetical protein WJX84_003597 [Apatococcus fuscideae]|uniref:Uncharacterized protein n=1 Tax=Apatococcus fuscideae TaxID=2026836 RepID=A0AAW1T3Z1_9CHLO